MIDVRQHLVVGVGVDGGHQAVHDADLVVQHLGQRCQAVGGARGVGDHLMRRRELVVVDAEHEGAVHVLVAGRGDDHFLGAGGEMRAGLGLGGEQAGAFQHHVDAQFAPGQLRRIALGANLDAVAVDDQVAAVHRHLAREFAVGGVVLGQVRVGLGIAEVVDRDDLELVRATGFVQRAQDVAANATVTVDGDLDGHGTASSK